MTSRGRPAPWHLSIPAFAPAKRVPVFLVTGVPCPDCACPAWLASTATDQELRWLGRLSTHGQDDLLLLRCSDCRGSITAPFAKVNKLDFLAPPFRHRRARTPCSTTALAGRETAGSQGRRGDLRAGTPHAPPPPPATAVTTGRSDTANASRPGGWTTAA
jgi:hypothetical protein